MDNNRMGGLSVRGRPKERNNNKGYGGRYKSKDTFKSPIKGIRKCCKCSKDGDYKKDFISKNVEKVKGSKDTPSIEVNTSSE